MRVRRRTEINAETQEVVLVRSAGREVVAWCDGCGERARMLVLDLAIALPGASSREINRRLKAGGIHFTETAQGLLICLNSLLKGDYDHERDFQN